MPSKKEDPARLSLLINHVRGRAGVVGEEGRPILIEIEKSASMFYRKPPPTSGRQKGGRARDRRSKGPEIFRGTRGRGKIFDPRREEKRELDSAKQTDFAAPPERVKRQKAGAQRKAGWSWRGTAAL